jgi:CheY-like chemotaxis protein
MRARAWRSGGFFQACRGRRQLGTLDVLLVEDDADSREALEIVLQQHGSRVRSVASVREALEAYDAQPPDVVISDVGMPGEMDTS